MRKTWVKAVHEQWDSWWVKRPQAIYQSGYNFFNQYQLVGKAGMLSDQTKKQNTGLFTFIMQYSTGVNLHLYTLSTQPITTTTIYISKKEGKKRSAL